MLNVEQLSIYIRSAPSPLNSECSTHLLNQVEAVFNRLCFFYVTDVHAMLLSDVLVFLQEKDQKYVFASLVRLKSKTELFGMI